MAQAEHTVDPLSGGPTPRGGLNREANTLDPELLALPAPPKIRRGLTLSLMTLVVVLSLGLIGSLRHDLSYFFSQTATVELGAVQEIDPATLPLNAHVRIEGSPMMSRATRFQRGIGGERYLIFPLAGQRTIYVQVQDGWEALARNEFSGRLVTFSQLGRRMATVQGHLQTEMDLPVSGDSFVILADEPPSSYGWALLLSLLSGLFILTNIVMFFRWFKPLKLGSDEELPAG